MLKNKLSTCLYGLKKISNNLKNTNIHDQVKEEDNNNSIKIPNIKREV